MWIRTAALAIAAALLTAAPSGAQPKKALNSAIIQVVGASPILLAPSRDADVTILASPPGEITVRLDKLQDSGGSPITAPGNVMELDLTVNGVAQPTLAVPFDISNGNAEIEQALGLTALDSVHIERLDFFDQNHDRFATLGVRIKSP